MDILKQIIQDGVLAPSGDNSQPWRFQIIEASNSILIYNDSKKDNQFFNYKQRGSLIAHGALIETMLVSGLNFGLKGEVDYFPNGPENDIVARLVFINSVPDSHLYSAIQKRATNRKPYIVRTFSEIERQKLSDFVCDFPEIKLNFQEEAGSMSRLGEYASLAERTMLEFKKLHEIFYSFVRWSKQEEEQTKNGLYIKTMEFLPPQKIIFKLLSFWPVAKVTKLIGLPKFIASENAKIYAKASAFGLFSISNHNPETYLNLGRSIAKLWLTVTSLGLSLQPITAVLYVAQRVFDNQTEGLEPEHQEKIKNAYFKIKNEFSSGLETPAFLFRVGEGGEPSARSSRMDPVYVK